MRHAQCKYPKCDWAECKAQPAGCVQLAMDITRYQKTAPSTVVNSRTGQVHEVSYEMWVAMGRPVRAAT